MPYYTETRTFTIEIEIHALAHIETGGGYSDEPKWAEIQEVEIDYVEVEGCKVIAIGHAMKEAFLSVAMEGFKE